MNIKNIEAYGFKRDDVDYFGFYLGQPLNRAEISILYITPLSAGLNYELGSQFEYGSDA